MRAAILAGCDPRTRDRGPIEFGAAVAELSGARLIVAVVQPGDPVMGVFPGTALPYAVDPAHDDVAGTCSPVLDEIAADLRARGVAFECRVIDGLVAARALQQAAEAARVGLLVVGAGRDKVLGSTAQRVLHGARCPVAVVRHEWRPQPLRTIGAGVAEVKADRDVIDAAHALARLAHARLRVLTVVPVTAELYARTQPVATHELERAVAALHDIAVDVGTLLGDPAERLVAASDQLDVLVCGSRGYGRVRAVLLGSVSRQLVADAHCPVIVLPRGVSGRLETLVAGETSAA